MNFYTSAERSHGRIYYVGYESNKRVFGSTKFKPTMYIPSMEKKSKYLSLAGMYLSPTTPGSMGECDEYIKSYSAGNFTVHGNKDYVAQYLQENFSDGCTPNIDFMKVAFIDIEVHSEEGFPKPEKAEFPIVAITLKYMGDEEFFTFGLKKYEPTRDIERYYHCTDERNLITQFLEFYSNNIPDVITGWYSKGFDIPYIIRRIENLFGPEMTKKMSIHNLLPEQKNSEYDGMSYHIPGTSHLDYLDLFKKFAGPAGYGQQESYSLDNIGEVVVGKKKLDYSQYGSLQNLYNDNPQLYIEYNIRDVELVEDIDSKLGLIELAMTLAHKANYTYESAFGSTRIWDAYIYNVLMRKNIIIPPADSPTFQSIEGAYVKEPVKGMYDWVASFDLNSLYPHLIMQYNMSPETIAPEKIDGMSVDRLLNGEFPDIPKNRCMSATGQLFYNDREGLFPAIVDNLYKTRSEKKKLMLRTESAAIKEKNPDRKKEMEREISRLNNEQHAIKIFLNSLYGAMSNRYFRYYDWRIAESITISGQLTIRWAEKALNGFLNKTMGTSKKDYVVTIDTDSLYVCLSPLIQKYCGGKSKEEIVDFIDRAGREKFEEIFDRSYEQLREHLNCKEQKMVMKRELIADRMIFTGKKRYIGRVLDKEGVRYSEPKIKITGIEAVRSSTPKICREYIKDLLPMILENDEKQVQKFINEKRKEFSQQRPEVIAFPRGISDMSKYWDAPKRTYTKGTPMHVRAAILFNEELKRRNLNNRYEMIEDGGKMRFLYLKLPNTINENVIGFSTVLPEEFGIEQYIDHETQFTKTFVDPIDQIIKCLNWSTESRGTLEDFFS
jgi:DNA polymerase elongation subunit (family B)